jgi:hypothetical protein
MLVMYCIFVYCKYSISYSAVYKYMLYTVLYMLAVKYTVLYMLAEKHMHRP